jgi:hypothetical protein
MCFRDIFPSYSSYIIVVVVVVVVVVPSIQEIEIVKHHYNKLKILNLKLKIRKQEVPLTILNFSTIVVVNP